MPQSGLLEGVDGLEPGDRLLLELVLDESVGDIEFSESLLSADPLFVLTEVFILILMPDVFILEPYVG